MKSEGGEGVEEEGGESVKGVQHQTVLPNLVIININNNINVQASNSFVKPGKRNINIKVNINIRNSALNHQAFLLNLMHEKYVERCCSDMMTKW